MQLPDQFQCRSHQRCASGKESEHYLPACSNRNLSGFLKLIHPTLKSVKPGNQASAAVHRVNQNMKLPNLAGQFGHGLFWTAQLLQCPLKCVELVMDAILITHAAI